MSEPLFKGKWIEIRAAFNPVRGDHSWEFASRTGSTQGVCMVCTDPDNGNLILVRQFRPPLKAWAIEFPAGLVDHGESPESAAIREMREETGYDCEVVSVGPPAFSSPGLTDEAVRMIHLKAHCRETPKHEPDEQIETFTLPLSDLSSALGRLEAEGNCIDAKLWSFAAGMALAAFRPGT